VILLTVFRVGVLRRLVGKPQLKGHDWSAGHQWLLRPFECPAPTEPASSASRLFAVSGALTCGDQPEASRALYTASKHLKAKMMARKLEKNRKIYSEFLDRSSGYSRLKRSSDQSNIGAH
jgi:hypothetical protein